MANPNPKRENLIPNSELTPKERQERASKMGKASGEARRKQKTLRETIKMIMGLDAKDSSSLKLMKEAGISESLSNATMVGLALVNKAKSGNIPAQRLLAEMMGENDTQGTVINNNLPPKININFVGDDDE